MKSIESSVKSILPRLVTRVVLVAAFTLLSLNIPLNATSDAIATPQTLLATTQSRMVNKQNRAEDKQNNPDGVEFGFEDEARILGAKDKLDDIKGAFGNSSSNQNTRNSSNRNTRNYSNRNTKTKSNQMVSSNAKEQPYGAVNNVERTVGTTKNLSDRSTAKAKQKANQDINKVENTAKEVGSDIKETAQQAQNRAAKDTNRLQNAVQDAGSNIKDTAGNLTSDLVDSFEAEDTNQSLAKKNKTVGQTNRR